MAASKTKRWDDPEEIATPTLWARWVAYYEQNTRTITTVVMVLLIGGTTLGIVNYRRTVQRARAYEDLYAAKSTVELEDLEKRTAGQEVYPIVLFRLGQLYQARGDVDSLKRAQEWYGKFGDQFPNHELAGPAAEALATIMLDLDFLAKGTQEQSLRYTLMVHPEIIDQRVRPEPSSGITPEPDLDAELLMTPFPQDNPGAMISVGEVHVTVELYPDDAPKLVAAFLNDLDIDAFRGNPFRPEDDGKRYRFSSGPPVPASFVRIRNGLELQTGSLVCEVNAEGKPILGHYLILNEKPEALAGLRDKYAVFGLTTNLAELARIADDATIGATQPFNKRRGD